MKLTEIVAHNLVPICFFIAAICILLWLLLT